MLVAEQVGGRSVNVPPAELCYYDYVLHYSSPKLPCHLGQKPSLIGLIKIVFMA